MLRLGTVRRVKGIYLTGSGCGVRWRKKEGILALGRDWLPRSAEGRAWRASRTSSIDDAPPKVNWCEDRSWMACMSRGVLGM